MHRRLVVAVFCALLPAALAPVWGQSAPLERTEPPRADRIVISTPGEDGLVRIEGRLNSVFPGAVVGIRDLFTGETDFAQAGLNGAFDARLPGVPGNPYWIQGDNNFPAPNAPLADGLPGDIGVIVYAPGAADRVSIAGVWEGERWTATGDAPRLTLLRGDPWPLAFEVATAAELPFGADLRLQPIAWAQDGRWQAASVAGGSGWAAETTASGLPVDGLATTVPLGAMALDAVSARPDGGLDYRLIFDAPIPDDVPRGLYAPLLRLPDGSSVRLPLVVRVGASEPAQLPMALFMDDGLDGARGLLPEGHAGGLSHGPRWNGPAFILTPGDYPLEPYLPTVLLNRGDPYPPPLIPFDLPGGRLQVTVERPDGQTDSFDAPFTQSWLGTTAEAESARFGGGPVNSLRLTTGVPELAAYPFDQYGAYAIRLSANLLDRFGNPYTGGGEYRVLVAEPLELRPAFLSGAPIPAGQPIDAGLHILPPVPADVTAALRHTPLNGVESVMRLNSQADSYGWFTPSSPFRPQSPGDYVFDYTATFTDEGGRLWAGSLRSAGVVADPAGPLVVHGGRGAAGQPPGTAPARYTLEALAAQTGDDSLTEGAWLNQPFYADTIARLNSGAAFGLAFPLHVQDRAGDTARAAVRAGLASEQDAARGELPAAAPGLSVAYLSAVTPGFSIRQQVIGGAEGGLPGWVSADDPLNQQIGAGATGLAEGDSIFLFGGVVAPGQQTTAGYAALALVTNGDPAALGVFEPPPGGAAPLAILPLSLLPGQRVTVGGPLTIGAQVAPPLPATVTAEFTRPDGTAETAQLSANEFGYAWDPTASITADTPGVWSVRLTAETSSGAAEQTFLVYVLPEDAAPLPWNPLLRDTAIPGATAYNFNFTAPEGWTDVRAYWTMTMAGAVLADGEARLAGRSLSAAYNPVEIQAAFPQFEVEGRADGPSGSDAVTITVAFTGLGADGAPQIQARTFTVFHDRLLTFDPAGAAP